MESPENQEIKRLNNEYLMAKHEEEFGNYK